MSGESSPWRTFHISETDRVLPIRHGLSLGFRVLDEPAEGIHELHLLDGLAASFEEARGADEDGETLGAGDGHVQAVA